MSKSNSLHFFLKLLSVRDYSHSELLKKVQNQDFDSSDIDQAVKYLISNNFLNDDRIAQNYINFYFKSKGKLWIWQKCKSKGITETSFEKAWQEFELNKAVESFDEVIYPELKIKVQQKYDLESFVKIDPNTLRKIYNYLIYRGFNAQELLENWKKTE